MSDQPPDRRFSAADLPPEASYGFARVIRDMRGGGLLMEVFAAKGPADAPISDVLESGRLFHPVAVSGLPIKRARWRKVHGDLSYGSERDSGYSRIQLVAGTVDTFQLWTAGEGVRDISNEDAADHERRDVWRAHHLERRIADALGIG